LGANGCACEWWRCRHRKRWPTSADARPGQSRPTAESSREHLCLMGWNIFLTNVNRALARQALAPLYRLRWRIEMIFKAWKSHLGFCASSMRAAVPSAPLCDDQTVVLCVGLSLLPVVGIAGGCPATGQPFTVGRIIGQCACLFAITILELTPTKWLEHHLTHHLFYEQRKDRKNYFELLAGIERRLRLTRMGFAAQGIKGEGMPHTRGNRTPGKTMLR